MEILSLFSKFTKVSRDLLFLMQGNFFFFLHWKLHSVKCNASHRPHPPICRWCTSSPPLAWKQCSRNRIELGVCDLRFVFLSGGSRYHGAFFYKYGLYAVMRVYTRVLQDTAFISIFSVRACLAWSLTTFFICGSNMFLKYLASKFNCSIKTKENPVSFKMFTTWSNHLKIMSPLRYN